MLPAPPKRPKPDAFYLDHLPQFWQAFLDAADLPPIALTIQVTIDGQEEYVVTIEGSRVIGRAGTAASPAFALHFDMEAFRTASRDLWPRAAHRLEQTADTARAWLRQAFATRPPQPWLGALLALPGELDIHYTDDAGDVSHTRLIVGTGPGAHARLAAADADVTALLDGNSNLWQLVNTRATLEGDSGWVLRLAARLVGLE